MRSLIPFAILIIFGIMALMTRQLWLFVIPAIFIGISLVWPSRYREEETEEAEYEPSEEEKEKIKGYADAFPSTTNNELEEDADFDLEDDDEEDIFADIDLDFEEEEDEEISPSLDDIEDEVVESPEEDLSASYEKELEDELEDVSFEEEEVTTESSVEETVEEDDFNDLFFDEVMNDTELEDNLDNEIPSFVEIDDDDDINLFIPENFVKEDEKDKGLDEIKEKALKDLDNLIGLENLKSEIKRVVKFLEVEKKRELAGKKTKPISLHMTFTGDAGTGKTTVARIIGELFKGIGILESGHFIETDRSGLVAGYVGQTAEKTKEMVQQALGGVLFIDEAYSLKNGDRDDFGQEAIDTLIKEMEDYRDKFVCILAGYDEDMDRLFNANQGFKSRVRYHFHFDNYSVDELMEMASVMLKGLDMKPTEEALDKLRQYFEEETKLYGFVDGNSRTVRNLIDQIHVNQSVRIADTGSEDYETVLPEDIPSFKKESSDEILEELLV